MSLEDSAPVEATEHAAGGIKGTLTKRLGPLPLWGWGIAAAGGLFIAYRLSATHAGTSVSGTPLPLPSVGGSGGGVAGGTPTGSTVGSTSGPVDTTGAGSVAPLAQAPLDIASLVTSIIAAVRAPLPTALGGTNGSSTSGNGSAVTIAPNGPTSSAIRASGTTVAVPQHDNTATGQTKYLFNGIPLAGEFGANGLPLPTGVTLNPAYNVVQSISDTVRGAPAAPVDNGVTTTVDSGAGYNTVYNDSGANDQGIAYGTETPQAQAEATATQLADDWNASH